MMTVAIILQLPVEGSNLVKIPPIPEEEASYMFKKKSFSIGSRYALIRAKLEWAPCLERIVWKIDSHEPIGTSCSL